MPKTISVIGEISAPVIFMVFVGYFIGKYTDYMTLSMIVSLIIGFVVGLFNIWKLMIKMMDHRE